MKTRRQRIGLQAGLAAQRDDRACRERPMLTDQHVLPVDDAHRVFRHDDHTKETSDVPIEQDGDEENERKSHHRTDRHELPVSHVSSPSGVASEQRREYCPARQASGAVRTVWVRLRPLPLC
jgi:hypothetical protein